MRLDLLIAGMNEGMVPDSLQGDAWLPDSVRALLDLKTNDTRLARDSYLLTTMIESRRSGGSIQLLAGRLTAAGDPLKPSRLLLRCPAADLPGRAVRLFPKETADESARPPALPWHRAWMLNVPPPRPDSKVFQRLNVTAFGEYLKCPFRFYLKYVLKMEPVDASRGGTGCPHRGESVSQHDGGLPSTSGTARQRRCHPHRGVSARSL